MPNLIETLSQKNDELRSFQDFRRASLASWIMTKVSEYEIARNGLPGVSRWKHYYHIWRGIYAEELNSSGRKVEVSKLIHPQTMEAIDSTRAEMASALIDGKLFKIDDDYLKENQGDLPGLQAKLEEDFSLARVKHSLKQIILIGTVFGTGVGRINITNHEELTLGSSNLNRPVASSKSRKLVTIEPLLPTQFVIDPAALTIKDALGCASIIYVPKHTILELQANGTYLAGDISTDAAQDTLLDNSDSIQDPTADTTKLVEWSGKVPRALLPGEGEREAETFDPALGKLPSLEIDESDLVEAVVTISSDTVVLKELENPSITKDRLFVAYRQDIIPGAFWGRGIAEKGFNPQMSLDAHMRATVEALALTVHPMFGLKQGALPRGVSFKVKPGRNYVFNVEDVRTALQKIDLGTIDPSQFANTAQLEKLVQMATGTFDTQVISQAQGQAPTGFNMVATNFIKRTKEAIGNFGEEIINEFVNIAARIYMQIETVRYPPLDPKFTVNSGIGALAKEMEQAQMINLLKTVPSDNIAWWLLIRGIIERSSLTEAQAMIQAVDGQIQTLLNPPPDPLQQAQLLEIQTKMRIQHVTALTMFIRAQAEIARAATQAAQADDEAAETQSKIILNLAKAEAQEVGNQVEKLEKQMQRLVALNGDEGNETNAAIFTSQQAASESLLELLTGGGVQNSPGGSQGGGGEAPI